MQAKITDRAHGRWKDILGTLGVDAKYLQDKHGPCPFCGGTDRFRWDNKDGKGTFYCSQCGAGDGVKFVRLLKGCDFKTAAREIEKVVGRAKVEASKPPLSAEDQHRAVMREWRWARPSGNGCPVDLYLQKRLGQKIDIPPTLRSAVRRPAMVAVMKAPDNEVTMVHLTLLTEAGEKAPVDKVKLFMRGNIAMGSAVRLAPAAEMMGIAEGIETALAATLLTGVPCWAALNERLLQQWEPPPEAKRIVVFGDNDRNFVGQAAAYSLAKRLSLRRGNPLRCDVQIPTERGDDWNDVLLKKSVN